MVNVSRNRTVVQELPDAFGRLRNVEFPWTGETAYLDNAATGPLPECSRRVLDEFTGRRTAPHLLPEAELFEVLSEARALLARLINADVDEIGLTVNTSFGLKLAALALPLEKGDTVLLSAGEFPANVYPWLRLASRDVRLEMVPTTAQGWPDEQHLIERVYDRDVRALAISFVQYGNGFRVDLRRLARACRNAECFLVVDGIQGVGHVPLDVKATPVDILACGAQKWLMSPWGTGFVYVRRELLRELDPAVVSWMAFEGGPSTSSGTDGPLPAGEGTPQFEANTLPFQDFAALNASVELLLKLGVPRIFDHVMEIREPMLTAAAAGMFKIRSPVGGRHESGIMSLNTPRPAEAYAALKRAGIICSLREGAIRLSPHCYNTVDEMVRVVDVLAAMQ